MHGHAREKSIQSHLKHVKNFQDVDLMKLEKLIDELLFKKLLAPGYVSNILISMRSRLGIDSDMIRDAEIYLRKQKRLINSCYKAYKKKTTHIFDKDGQQKTFEQLLCPDWENLFKKKEERERRSLTVKEASQVLKYIHDKIQVDNWETVPYLNVSQSLCEVYLLLRIMYSNGARKNEIYQLKSIPVLEHLLEKNFTIIHGKTRAEQPFYLDNDTLNFVKLYRKKFGDPLFKCVERTHGKMYKQTLIELGFKNEVKTELKSWRNLFAARAKIEDPEMAQNIMNHSSAKMTNYYAKKIEVNDVNRKLVFLNNLANKKSPLL